ETAQKPLDGSQGSEGKELAGSAQAGTLAGGHDFMSHVGAMMAQHELTRKLKLPPFILDRMFPWVARVFHKTRGHVQGFGVKNNLFATVLTLLIFLFVGSTLISWATRAIKWTVRSAVSAVMGSGQTRAVRASAVPGPQSSGEAGSPAIPPGMRDQVDVDSQRALNFAKDFYTPDYHDTDTWMQFMSYVLAPGYSDAFFKAFCPPERIEDIRNRKLKGEFHSNQPVKLLGMEANGEAFLVQGMATLTSYNSQMGQVLAQGPVALEVHVARALDGKDVRISGVVERTALNVPGGSNPQPVSKALKPAAPQKAARGKARKAKASVQVAPVSNPNTIPSWAQDEIPVAGDFTSMFYGVSYSNWDDTLGYLRTQVLPNYAPALVAQFFPSSLQTEMQNQ
ncbi:MAG TPA: hypothetical protein VJ873_11090, partial [bacterium]|nr:hypothetical protein [bacterium]